MVIPTIFSDSYYGIELEEFNSYTIDKKLRLYIETTNEDIFWGQPNDPTIWEDNIKAEGIKALPTIKLLIISSSIGYTKSDLDYDTRLLDLMRFIEHLYTKKLLQSKDIEWIISEYEKKLIEYIKDYNYINIVVVKFQRFFMMLSGHQNINSIPNSEISRLIYIKFRNKGFDYLKVTKDLMFNDYEQLKEKSLKELQDE